MRYQKPSSLFWTWGAYVFLPINIIIGTIISEEGATLEELLLSSIIALAIMMGMAYPAVCLSSKYNMNYAQSINYFIKYKALVMCLILIVPLVNIGWYSIQTVMFAELLQTHLNVGNLGFAVLIIGMSYIFAIGVTKYDYLWLKNAGLIGMLFLFVMLLYNIKIENNIVHGFIRYRNIVNYTIQILGTWIFSSVTCIMDITSCVEDGKKGFRYIVLSTFVTNIMLIILGYVISISIESFVSLNILNLLAILIAIWTTNDSNFYSTMCSLNVMGVSKKVILLLLPLVSSMISIFVIKDFESFIVKWLSVMSWIGIPLGIMWWIIYIKKGGNKNDNCA